MAALDKKRKWVADHCPLMHHDVPYDVVVDEEGYVRAVPSTDPDYPECPPGTSAAMRALAQNPYARPDYESKYIDDQTCIRLSDTEVDECRAVLSSSRVDPAP